MPWITPAVVPVVRAKVPVEAGTMAAEASVASGRTGVMVGRAVCTITGVELGMVVGVSRITCGVSSTNWGVGLLATVGTGVANPARGVGLGGTDVGVGAMEGISDPQLARSKVETINRMKIG